MCIENVLMILYYNRFNRDIELYDFFYIVNIININWLDI